MLSPVPDLSSWMTSPQAATALGCSVRTVHRHIEAGTLRAERIATGPNGAYLISRRDVERLAAKLAAERAAKIAAESVA